MKKFNDTGTCIPEKHYMVDTCKKLDKIMGKIDEEEYFVINRPRQYGKTTTFFLLNKRLKNSEEYLPIKMSFEDMGDSIFNEEESFVKEFLQSLVDSLLLNYEKLAGFLEEEKSKVKTFKDLSRSITKFVIKAEKKVVLMIDEVDKSSNSQLFLNFLGMLRSKYLLRNEGEDTTFHSVILAGVHDIKTLKLKMRPDDEHKFNSPWNIASDFDVDMSFSIEEIKTMLDDYTREQSTSGIQVEMDKQYFSERLYFYTSGYPFLVSKLCKIIDEKLLGSGSGQLDKDLNKSLKWGKSYIEESVKILLKENNTNFESLIKNLENNTELYEFVKKIIIDGEEFSYIQTDELVSIGTMYGIFKESNGKCKINNRIYEQLIYDHMSMKIARSSENKDMTNYNFRENFINEDKTLNFEKLLLKFQEFMKEQYTKRNNKFIEENGRLVFLAFLKPIINGIGFDFKEAMVSEEKRLDIVVTYLNKKYVVELKLWRGQKAHENGTRQLSDYLDRTGLDKGYLIIYDLTKKGQKEWKREKIAVDNKEIFAVWV
jgi:hypothetical protein